MERDPADIKRYPCGRVEVSVKLNRILLCSLETYLEAIDPDSLEATGKIGFRAAQYIYDFVVDDVRGQVAVLALESGSIRLRIYSLPDGANLQQLAFPAVSIRGMKLALIPKQDNWLSLLILIPEAWAKVTFIFAVQRWLWIVKKPHESIGLGR